METQTATVWVFIFYILRPSRYSGANGTKLSRDEAGRNIALSIHVWEYRLAALHLIAGCRAGYIASRPAPMEAAS
jgi:hypothetical protein